MFVCVCGSVAEWMMVWENAEHFEYFWSALKFLNSATTAINIWNFQELLIVHWIFQFAKFGKRQLTWWNELFFAATVNAGVKLLPFHFRYNEFTIYEIHGCLGLSVWFEWMSCGGLPMSFFGTRLGAIRRCLQLEFQTSPNFGAFGF